MKRLITLFLTTALLLTTGLSYADDITVSDTRVREVPPGIMNSAGFFTLSNSSDKEIALLKATSDISRNTELHEHVHESGMMKMRQVSKIIIPSNGKRLLKPGGYHVMLIGLTKKIKAGDSVEITLEFDNDTKQTVKAEVKKINSGMMKKIKPMTKEMKVMAHVSPMPNFMSVYIKMGDKLDLSTEQKEKLDAGITERTPKMKDLVEVVMKIEADIQHEALNGGLLTDIDQLANNLMHERLAIIDAKNDYRETAKKILTKEQFKKVTQLYREKMMPEPKAMTKMAMNKHSNPMPNLMLVVKKMADKLNLTKEQAADLKRWQDERGPIMEKQYKAVVNLEKEIHELSLNSAPNEKLAPLADSIMQIRMKIIRGKALCRDNMERILDKKQFDQVISLYKENFMEHKMDH